MKTDMAVRVAVVAALLTGAVTAPAARAARIKIDSGRAVVAWDDASFFELQGDGLHLTGLFVSVPESPQRICFSGCAPGTRVDMNAVLGGPSILSLGGYVATAVINGITYTTGGGDPSLTLGGEMHFRAPPVRLPPLHDGLLILTAPFAFTGHITGFASDATDGSASPVFQADVVGRGTARLQLIAVGDAWRFPEVTYDFGKPARH
jgi:hypothetical protein